MDIWDAERYPKYVEKEWNISKMQYQQVVDFVKANSDKPYCGASYNCTDFVIGAAGKAGINIPRSKVQTLGITDPNKLADYLEGK